MRKLLLILPALGLLAVAGCGSDDDSGSDSGPTEKIVTAVALANGPSMTTPNAAEWSQPKAVTVGINSGGIDVGAKERPTAAQSVASEVNVQAIVANDSLYLRFIWADNTFDAWPGAWDVDSLTPSNLPIFEQLTTQDQDQLLVLFAGLPNSTWDMWHWKAHSTAISGDPDGIITGFAEGRTLTGTQFVTDAGDLEIVRENHPFDMFIRPTFLHPDSMDFHGFILAESVADSLAELEFPYDGWQLHDTVPGYLTDQSVADSSAAARNSRWDIQGVWRHSTSQYTVVLRAALNTGYNDDLAMTSGEKVPMKLILTNKLRPTFQFNDVNQGITDQFYLQLP